MDDSVVPVDSNGFKQYDLLDALHMDKMMEEIYSWWRDPQSYHQSTCATTEAGRTEVFVVIVEGFLIFNHRPLNELMNKKYFLEIPYDECQNRRCSRVYTPPDPPGYFDGHVWPMYLKNRQEMQLQGIVFLDGLKSEAELLRYVYDDITTEIKNLRGKTEINSVNL
ncbi:nicotinamide riboside kinase 1 isoform X2 [Gadus morhua]|uniref:nicotinamide riboside kinase 1 isoform X2 n=1 Tax=Gadus morhua TaxID=8049 RepID=UPI0011B3D334|nr:nicotinamide riboside kinase 1 isoform X2 [Gadus morhua]